MTTFTHLCKLLITRIDKGESVSVREISEMAEDKTLVSWIDKEFRFDMWKGGDKEFMDDLFTRLASESSADEFSINNNGLCLLLRCCTSCIESYYIVDP
ncbi:MAG: hypothetical protein SNJ29_12470 [Rikenellaceae bacterium]